MLFVVNVFSLEPCPFVRNFSDLGHDDEIDRSTHSSVEYGRATSSPSTSDEGIYKALGVNEGHPGCPSDCRGSADLIGTVGRLLRLLLLRRHHTQRVSFTSVFN